MDPFENSIQVNLRGFMKYRFAPALKVSYKSFTKYNRPVEVEKIDGSIVHYWDSGILKRLPKGDFDSLYVKEAK
jgi:hypothetical protein